MLWAFQLRAVLRVIDEWDLGRLLSARYFFLAMPDSPVAKSGRGKKEQANAAAARGALHSTLVLIAAVTRRHVMNIPRNLARLVAELQRAALAQVSIGPGLKSRSLSAQNAVMLQSVEQAAAGGRTTLDRLAHLLAPAAADGIDCNLAAVRFSDEGGVLGPRSWYIDAAECMSPDVSSHSASFSLACDTCGVWLSFLLCRGGLFRMRRPEPTHFLLARYFIWVRERSSFCAAYHLPHHRQTVGPAISARIHAEGDLVCIVAKEPTVMSARLHAVSRQLFVGEQKEEFRLSGMLYSSETSWAAEFYEGAPGTEHEPGWYYFSSAPEGLGFAVYTSADGPSVKHWRFRGDSDGTRFRVTSIGSAVRDVTALVYERLATRQYFSIPTFVEDS